MDTQDILTNACEELGDALAEIPDPWEIAYLHRARVERIELSVSRALGMLDKLIHDLDND